VQKHLLLVSFLPPMQGTGTSIILERHLLQLDRKGWKVSVVVPEHRVQSANKLSNSWQVIPLLARRWWWPPFRPQIPGSLEMRLHLWQLECERVLGREKPSAILTVLWDIYPLLAMRLSKSWKVPLSVIIHDQPELWTKSEAEHRLIRQRSATILNQAARVWPVSRELGDVYKLKETQKISVLSPIPEENSWSFSEWKSYFKSHPVVAHAGSLHQFQLPNLQSLASALQKVNGTLLLITPGNNPVLSKLLEVYPNVKYHEPFAHNRDVIKFLSDNASCILVSYSFGVSEQPWAATSFPSKLVEFSHLGLPVLILAPSSTAISNWAKEHQWLSYISQLNEAEFLKVLNKLTVKETWLEMAQQTQKVALNEFNPNLIQSQFESELALALHARYANT